MKTIRTEYVNKADETIETIQLENGNIIYAHTKNGYVSIIDGVMNLIRFMDGDVNARFTCLPMDIDLEKFLDGCVELFS